MDDLDAVRWTQAHVTAFQLRAPNITNLKLYCSSLTLDDLRTALRHAPSLTHLELVRCPACVDDTLIDALCHKAGVSPLVPHLHDLCLDDSAGNFTKDNLVGMITSRWWTDAELALCLIPPAVARWTRVELWGNRDAGLHVMNILQDLSCDVPFLFT
ncbi:hypothetical protein B0H12DRAFT_94613 [Mycena haematopus]|nr:hypothetical protein B0H12DRAFT_94613 [Mycena haematopus]